MNKKEIAEIKKQFTPANCAITRICGCYVDAEKNKKTKIKEAFLSLPEEEMFKYFDIFKKTMSGRLGKNLMNLDFPLAQEKEGGTQELLMQIRESKLKDDELLDEFYDKVITDVSFMQYMTFPEKLLMEPKCTILQKKSMNTFCAAFVQ